MTSGDNDSVRVSCSPHVSQNTILSPSLPLKQTLQAETGVSTPHNLAENQGDLSTFQNPTETDDRSSLPPHQGAAENFQYQVLPHPSPLSVADSPNLRWAGPQQKWGTEDERYW